MTSNNILHLPNLKKSKYIKIIFDLYLKAKTLEKKRYLERIFKEKYFEEHHYIPKSLGGKDDADNLVLLTLREHALIHIMLTKIFLEGSDEALKMQRSMFVFYKTSKTRLNSGYLNTALYENKRIEFLNKMSQLNTLRNPVSKKVLLEKLGSEDAVSIFLKNKNKKTIENRKSYAGKNNPQSLSSLSDTFGEEKAKEILKEKGRKSGDTLKKNKTYAGNKNPQSLHSLSLSHGEERAKEMLKEKGRKVSSARKEKFKSGEIFLYNSKIFTFVFADNSIITSRSSSQIMSLMNIRLKDIEYIKYKIAREKRYLEEKDLNKKNINILDKKGIKCIKVSINESA
jgi:hypothetical protein